MYKIIGSDQKTYGPVSLAQLRQWMAEGRVNLGTLVQPEGATDWKPLSVFPELAVPPPLALPPRPVRDEGGSMAVAGLICGILSIACCCFGRLLGAAGVILSAIALSQSSNDPQRRGRGMAMAGLILSILALLWHSIIPGLLGLWWLGPFRHHLWHAF